VLVDLLTVDLASMCLFLSFLLFPLISSSNVSLVQALEPQNTNMDAEVSSLNDASSAIKLQNSATAADMSSLRAQFSTTATPTSTCDAIQTPQLLKEAFESFAAVTSADGAEQATEGFLSKNSGDVVAPIPPKMDCIIDDQLFLGNLAASQNRDALKSRGK
jgi:hypothetical protein